MSANVANKGYLGNTYLERYLTANDLNASSDIYNERLENLAQAILGGGLVFISTDKIVAGTGKVTITGTTLSVYGNVIYMDGITLTKAATTDIYIYYKKGTITKDSTVYKYGKMLVSTENAKGYDMGATTLTNDTLLDETTKVYDEYETSRRTQFQWFLSDATYTTYAADGFTGELLFTYDYTNKKITYPTTVGVKSSGSIDMFQASLVGRVFG